MSKDNYSCIFPKLKVVYCLYYPSNIPLTAKAAAKQNKTRSKTRRLLWCFLALLSQQVSRISSSVNLGKTLHFEVCSPDGGYWQSDLNRSNPMQPDPIRSIDLNQSNPNQSDLNQSNPNQSDLNRANNGFFFSHPTLTNVPIPVWQSCCQGLWRSFPIVWLPHLLEGTSVEAAPVLPEMTSREYAFLPCGHLDFETKLEKKPQGVPTVLQLIVAKFSLLKLNDDGEDDDVYLMVILSLLLLL